jgi:hypothetical protein
MKPPVLYVLDVPEFASVVEASRNIAGVEVRRHGEYWRVSGPDTLVFSRRGLRLHPAVWWGMFTGGFVGRIAEMTPNVVRVVGEPHDGHA